MLYALSLFSKEAVTQLKSVMYLADTSGKNVPYQIFIWQWILKKEKRGGAVYLHCFVQLIGIQHHTCLRFSTAWLGRWKDVKMLMSVHLTGVSL